MNINKKNKGYSLLEILFAIVILSFALSTIFITLNNMFKSMYQAKKLSYNINKTPIIYSQASPIINYQKIENYKSELYSLMEMIEIKNYEDSTLSPWQLTTLFLGSFQDNQNKSEQKLFSNIIFIPLKNKESDEKKN
jgi:prepilin-type N-terminal cleavage/methylation domain-containing protein